MFIPKCLERQNKFYEEMSSVCSSIEKTTLEEDSFAGWSTSGGDVSIFQDDYEKMKSGTTFVRLVVNWSKKQSKVQIALYLLGCVAGVIILVAATVVFREWGLTGSDTESGLIGGSFTPSPSVSALPEPSEEPPLPWATQEPTTNPLLPDFFPNQPTALVPSPEAPSNVVMLPSAVPVVLPNSTAIPVAPPSPTDGPVVPPSRPPATIAAPAPETLLPSREPIFLSEQPFQSPWIWTRSPTEHPSSSPPTFSPSTHSTSEPTPDPTGGPTKDTTVEPIGEPVADPTVGPSVSPVDNGPTYVPGNLTMEKLGLLLSEGLDARLLAMEGEKVEYDFGDRSRDRFHAQPDAGATFPDPRKEDNPGGWIYVSNSEVDDRRGGAGALTFDREGNVLEYKMLLEGTNMNCGGGRTPWNTWVSCEEVEHTGLIYQVDPTGERDPEVMTLGSDGGRWESFAYDIRDLSRPRYFVTEDHNKGTVRRFTPDSPDWDDEPWNQLHGSGTTDYLMIFPNSTNNGGTFIWTDDFEGAKNNARAFYPQTEGIDVYGSQLFYVCKRIKQLFVLNLDDGTYYNHTTVNGLFDGKPDQMQRLVDDQRDLLYFTEEGGVDAGVHARDNLGRFYTVFESPEFNDETTGLSFSPDGRFMYIAYQNNGLLFQIWRKDGFPFQARSLDVKYHQS